MSSFSRQERLLKRPLVIKIKEKERLKEGKETQRFLLRAASSSVITARATPGPGIPLS